MKQYIGIDIGGTKIAVVKGDENGSILNKIYFENDAPMERMVEKILDAAASLGDAEAIGISCGGPLDTRRGLICSPPNLPGWDNVPIVRLVEERCKMPAFLQNDADACALAEWKFGAGRGTQNMIFLTFGTGMGAGLILNGRLYAGTCGSAGEVGHIAMEKDGPIGYGKAGSFEGFCSGGGLKQIAVREAKRIFASGGVPSYCASVEQIPTISARRVAEAAQAGHPDAMRIYTECGTMLGRGLSILIDLLNPEMIVIGSIYARAQNLLEASMRESIAREALQGNAAVCRIMPAALGERLGDVAAISVAVNGTREV